MLQEVLRHADAGVLHHNLILAVPLEVKLPDLQPDFRARVAVLQGVGEEVVEDLSDFELVPHHNLVVHIQVNCERLALPLRLVMENSRRLLHVPLQVEALVVEGVLPRLHFGQLQNVVDQRQQLPAGKLNLLHVVPHFLAVVLAVLGQLGEADDGVERGAHVVGHAAEEVRLGLCALLGRLQRLLEDNGMLELLPFLNVHVPEAEDHFVGGQLLIIEGADVHPFIDLAEAAPVVAAVVGDVLAHPLADAFQREAQLKFLVGPRFHHLLYRGQQEVVPSRPGHLGLQIPGHLDGLVGPFAEVHPVDGVKGVAENPDGIARLFNPLVLLQIPDYHGGQHAEEQQAHAGQHIRRRVAVAQEDIPDGNGHNHSPAVAHDRVVGSTLHPLHVFKGRVVGGQGSVLNPCHQEVQVGLKGLLIRVPLGHGVEHGAGGVAQVVGAVFRQGLGRVMEPLVADIDVHGQHIPAAGQRLGDGKNRFARNGVGVHVAEHYLAAGLHRAAVPVRGLVLVARVPLPRVGRHNFAVNHRIWVHRALAQHGGQLGKIAAEPVLDLVCVPALAVNLIHVLGGQIHDLPEIVQVHLLLHGVALGQGHAQVLGVLQQLGPHKEDAERQQHSHQNQHEKAQCRIG
ncbi:Uncharacterised protein [uncultured Flavonifractor sp.]|nr:Uncharacterised protein [uncultured Flavonifractor sp.]